MADKPVDKVTVNLTVFSFDIHMHQQMIHIRSCIYYTVLNTGMEYTFHAWLIADKYCRMQTNEFHLVELDEIHLLQWSAGPRIPKS